MTKHPISTIQLIREPENKIQGEKNTRISLIYLKKFGLMLTTFVLATAILIAVMNVFLLSTELGQVIPARAADPAPSSAPHEWVIVAGFTGTINIIDPTTDMVYGPFLSGTLGSSGGGVFDVAVTPDGNTALISNFGDSAVFFVDISNPISPSVIMSVTTPMFAEDIAISHNGEFALVTDGGFSPYIAVIDLETRSLAYTVTLETGYANAIDIAPDGTVVVVDYFGGYVQALYPDASGVLTVTGIYTYNLTPEGQITPTNYLEAVTRAWPSEISELPAYATDVNDLEVSLAVAAHVPGFVNVAIAPDGQTVLVCDVRPYNDSVENPLYSVGVFRIMDHGVLSHTGVITGLSRAAQSIAFSPDGTKAYLPGNGGDMTYFDAFNHLMILEITGPGMVSLYLDNAADYPRLTTSQLFGVDTIAVSTDKAYISYPTVSGASNDLRVVDLFDYSVSRIDLNGIPTGVAVIPIHRIYIPFVVANYP